jgi:hypothetical protein
MLRERRFFGGLGDVAALPLLCVRRYRPRRDLASCAYFPCISRLLFKCTAVLRRTCIWIRRLGGGDKLASDVSEVLVAVSRSKLVPDSTSPPTVS